MNTLHGQPVEVGDEVYLITYGYGKVLKLYPTGRILVGFPLSLGTAQMVFLQDGRSRVEDVYPTLYWTKPEITGGLKKKTKVRKARYAVRGQFSDIFVTDPKSEDELRVQYPNDEILCEIPGTEVMEYL